MMVDSHLRQSTTVNREEEHYLITDAERHIKAALRDLYTVKVKLAERIGQSPSLNAAIEELVATTNRVRHLTGKDDIDERRAIFDEA